MYKNDNCPDIDLVGADEASPWEVMAFDPVLVGEWRGGLMVVFCVQEGRQIRFAARGDDLARGINSGLARAHTRRTLPWS